MDFESCNFPVFATQGGGYAREINGAYIFITTPDCPGLRIGDEVPKEWDLIPVNTHAKTLDELPWDEMY